MERIFSLENSAKVTRLSVNNNNSLKQNEEIIEYAHVVANVLFLCYNLALSDFDDLNISLNLKFMSIAYHLSILYIISTLVGTKM